MKIRRPKKLRHALEDARLILDKLQKDVFLKECAHRQLDEVYRLLLLVESSLVKRRKNGKRGHARSVQTSRQNK